MLFFGWSHRKRSNSQVFLKDFFSERRIFVSQPILIKIGMKKLFYFTNLLKSGAYGYLDFSCEISNIFRQSQNLRFPFFIPSFAVFSIFRKTLSKVCFVVLFFSKYRNRASFWFKNHWNPFIKRKERVFQSLQLAIENVHTQNDCHSHFRLCMTVSERNAVWTFSIASCKLWKTRSLCSVNGFQWFLEQNEATFLKF